MPQKSFLYIDFQPAVWRNIPLQQQVEVERSAWEIAFSEVAVARPLPSGGDKTPSSTVIVGEPAPDDVERGELQTSFSPIDPTIDEFNPFNVKHDRVAKVTAYANATAGDPNPENTVDRNYVYPVHYLLYGFSDNPNRAFITAQDYIVKQMFRRVRVTYGIHGAALRFRNVDLLRLEESLDETEIIGYKLIGVNSQTPIRTYDVVGVDMTNNAEVQDAKRRAENVKALAVSYQHHDKVLRLWLYQNGGVTFQNYPGDESGLGLLSLLNAEIERCSETELARVR